MAPEEEVADLLRELLREPGALAAAVAPAGSLDAADLGVPAGRRLGAPLDEGQELVVVVADETDLEAALRRTTRALTLCRRRHGGGLLPEVRQVGRAPRTRADLARRIEALLAGFAAAQGTAAAVILRAGELVATVGALDEARRERLPFLRRRIDAEAVRLRGHTSHAEVAGDDVFARAFGFDAYLIAFFDGPYAIDFVRHRARAVLREIAPILPHLDGESGPPAGVLPPPGSPREA